MIIGLARVDDRLIHGQVATVWTRDANVTRIIVISDDVAQDEIRKTLLKQAAPPGIKTSVVGIDKAIRVNYNPKYAEDRVMLLFTTPLDVERVIDKGININSLNIGGISFKKGKKQLTKSVFVNEEEAKSLKKLNDSGVELDVRGVVNDSQVDIMPLINQHF